MNKNNRQSYSLLSQNEIDVLVSFLTDKKSSVNSDVLNQHSIDKLIYLITNNRQQMMKNLFDPLADVDSELLISLDFRKTKDDRCELRCDIEEQTKFLQLTAYNPETEASMKITPKTLFEDDIEDWGACISPMLFNRLARALSLKYTMETYQKICAGFALVTYGDSEHAISSLYLPAEDHLLETLL